MWVQTCGQHMLLPDPHAFMRMCVQMRHVCTDAVWQVRWHAPTRVPYRTLEGYSQACTAQVNMTKCYFRSCLKESHPTSSHGSSGVVSDASSTCSIFKLTDFVGLVGPSAKDENITQSNENNEIQLPAMLSLVGTRLISTSMFSFWHVSQKICTSAL